MNITLYNLSLVENVEKMRQNPLLNITFIIVIVLALIGTMLGTLLTIFIYSNKLYDQNMKILAGSFSLCTALFHFNTMGLSLKNLCFPAASLIISQKSCGVWNASQGWIYLSTTLFILFLSIERFISSKSPEAPKTRRFSFLAISLSFSVSTLLILKSLFSLSSDKVLVCWYNVDRSKSNGISIATGMSILCIVSIVFLVKNNIASAKKLAGFSWYDQNNSNLMAKFKLVVEFESNEAVLSQIILFSVCSILSYIMFIVSTLTYSAENEEIWVISSNIKNIFQHIFSVLNLSFLMYTKKGIGKQFRKFYKLDKLSNLVHKKVFPVSTVKDMAREKYFEDLKKMWS